MTSSITDQLKDLKLDFVRPSGRDKDQLRDIKITRGFTKHAEGSVLIEFGDTRPASFEKQKQKWISPKRYEDQNARSAKIYRFE